ncbi:hypothetical protein SAMN02799636_05730 [Methylobacterium sp. 275MFSha3.1]|nr:hypothetical protein SAMN02799636_05730 [Methylobacterium sp. 275MFSha3.1]
MFDQEQFAGSADLSVRYQWMTKDDAFQIRNRGEMNLPFHKERRVSQVVNRRMLATRRALEILR